MQNEYDLDTYNQSALLIIIYTYLHTINTTLHLLFVCIDHIVYNILLHIYIIQYIYFVLY